MESTNEIFINEKEYPTLYKLYTEGFSFRNNYSPRNNCSTGNNEMTSMTSLFTINNTCTANTYKKNVYPEAIFNIFNNKGYTTSSYHDYAEYYYARRTIHPNMGSMAYRNVTELKIPWSSVYEERPSDTELVEKATPYFINEEHFMAYLTTVTPHQPYTVSSEMGDKHLEEVSGYDYSINTKRYMSKLKELDAALKLLLEKLEAAGILDNTIIVFSSDHGDMLGEYGHKDKGVPYEGSARIPFVIRYPKAIKAGTIVNKAANTTDWMDTFLSLMKVDSKVFDPNSTEGRNIASVFTKNSDDVEDITFVRFQTWAAVMTDRYKLVFDTSATKPWLIDLELDPLEGTNFIDSKDHKAIVKMLAKRLLEYGIKSKDDIVLHNKIKPLIEVAIKS